MWAGYVVTLEFLGGMETASRGFLFWVCEGILAAVKAPCRPISSPRALPLPLTLGLGQISPPMHHVASTHPILDSLQAEVDYSLTWKLAQ